VNLLTVKFLPSVSSGKGGDRYHRLCPSVCQYGLSVTLQYWPTIMRFSPNGGPKTSFQRDKDVAEIGRVSPQRENFLEVPLFSDV